VIPPRNHSKAVRIFEIQLIRGSNRSEIQSEKGGEAVGSSYDQFGGVPQVQKELGSLEPSFYLTEGISWSA
jgi:hypothetical protein